MKKWERLTLVGLLVVLLTAVSPILLSGNKLNLHCDGDSFLFYARHEHLRMAIFEYHVFPQRTPFFGGGVTPFADPEDPSLSPLTLVTLLLGTIYGLKIIQVCLMAVGVIGMFLLLRESLETSPLSAAAGSLVFGLSPTIPIRVLDGNPNEIYYTIIPLCLYFLQKARHRSRYLLFSGALLCLILLDGKLSFVTSSLYCAILAICSALPGLVLWPQEPFDGSRRFRDFRLFIAAMVIVAGLGAYRIIPALAGIAQAGGLSEMKLLFRGNTYAGMPIPFYLAQLVSWGDTGTYGHSSHAVSWIPLICIIPGLIYQRRRVISWLFVGLLFSFLEMGRSAPVDIFRLLFALPIFDKIGNPAKYFAPFVVITVAIITAIGLDAPGKRLGKKATVIRGLAIIGIVALLFPQNYEINSKTYTGMIPADYLRPSEEFYQIRGDNLPREGLRIPGFSHLGERPLMCKENARPIQANTYVNLLRGLGTIDWYTAMPLPENASPRKIIDAGGTARFNENYSGKCYKEYRGSHVSCKFEINRIIVMEAIEASDVLIVNQNYDPGWRSTEGHVYNRNGRIAVGGGINAGTVLTFTSKPLLWGVFISCMFLVGFASLAIYYRIALMRGTASRRLFRFIKWMIGA